MDSKVMEEIVDIIKNTAKHYDIEKVIMFGSRAKGTNNNFSDIDLAVTGDQYTDFALALEYEVITLYRFDVHNYNDISTSLRNEINKTGVTIYEKI